MVETMVEVAKLAIMFNCGTKDIGRGQSDDRNVKPLCLTAAARTFGRGQSDGRNNGGDY